MELKGNEARGTFRENQFSRVFGLLDFQMTGKGGFLELGDEFQKSEETKLNQIRRFRYNLQYF